MRKLSTILLASMAIAALSACADREQTAATPSKDTSPYAGTGVASFTAPGWKAGDKTAWEQQLKTRMQNGQNEYNKAN
jgi:hypothetical protein